MRYVLHSVTPIFVAKIRGHCANINSSSLSECSRRQLGLVAVGLGVAIDGGHSCTIMNKRAVIFVVVVIAIAIIAALAVALVVCLSKIMDGCDTKVSTGGDKSSTGRSYVMSLLSLLRIFEDFTAS